MVTITPKDTETESTEEEVEPKLKYVRITNDLQNILNKDAVTCVAVHPRVSTHSEYGLILQCALGNLVNVQMDSFKWLLF